MKPTLHLETYGEGPQTVVVCNGLSQSTANWRGIARQNPNLKWVLFDARGHGRSPLGPRPYHIDDHVADLMQIMERTQTQTAYLLGFSHGGRVAIRAAAQFPDAFKALILISTGAKNTPLRQAHVQSWSNCLALGGVEAMAWSSLPNIVGVKILEKFPDLSILVKGSAARNRKDGLEAMFEGMLNYPPTYDDAIQIQCPTLVFHGGQDPLVKDEDFADLRSWIPESQGCRFEDCGHTLPLEEPARFSKALLGFLNDQRVFSNL